ncbi:hypothetical protein, partial [uncultured Maribacter sp.]|uniref:hypothetical protein n=1 Tax=uncultured Maribacter sp. TaxID=431308 RepID=UPI0026100020
LISLLIYIINSIFKLKIKHTSRTVIFNSSKKQKMKIGIGIIIIAVLVLGIGIGLKLSDSKIETESFTIAGLVLNSIGLLILVFTKKKADK